MSQKMFDINLLAVRKKKVTLALKNEYLKITNIVSLMYETCG